jgi:hypothetical protein
VQTTPVNLLYATTYYTSTVTRRGFFLESCRTLLYAQALRDHETCAKSGEMWDCGCESSCAATGTLLADTANSHAHAWRQ